MTADDARRWLVAYDIADDQRRVRVARALEQHGDRVQYSVFVIDLKPARLLRLRVRLEQLILRQHDSVLFCDLGALHAGGVERIQTIGRPLTVTPHGPLVL